MSKDVTEVYPGGATFSILNTRLIARQKSKYQLIEIFESESFGKILLLDGLIMFTERDFKYNREMMVNISLHCRPSAKRVLIIGGGDGSSPGEAMKYRDVEAIDVVEIDREVTHLCRTHFPFVADAFSDGRVRYIFQEGAEFVKETHHIYGAIIISPTDPGGISAPLYQIDFFRDCFSKTDESGVLCLGGFSSFYELGTLKPSEVFERLKSVFPIVNRTFVHLAVFICNGCTFHADLVQIIPALYESPGEILFCSLANVPWRRMCIPDSFKEIQSS